MEAAPDDARFLMPWTQRTWKVVLTPLWFDENREDPKESLADPIGSFTNLGKLQLNGRQNLLRLLLLPILRQKLLWKRPQKAETERDSVRRSTWNLHD
jgi:hypothetical protein